MVSGARLLIDPLPLRLPVPVNFENAAIPPAPPSAPSRVKNANRQTSKTIGIRNWITIWRSGWPDCGSTTMRAPELVSVVTRFWVAAPEVG